MSKKNHRQSAAPYAKGYSEAGASVTRRALKGFTPDSGSPNEDINRNNATLRQRSRMLYMASPVATSAINTNRTKVVGTGLTLKATVDRDLLGLSPEAAKEWQHKAEMEFRLWGGKKQNCDALGLNNFMALQQLALKSWLMSGDVFVLVKRYPATPLNPYSMRLHVIEADRVSTPTDFSGGYTYGGFMDAVVPDGMFKLCGMENAKLISMVQLNGGILLMPESVSTFELITLIDALTGQACEFLEAVAAECGPAETEHRDMTLDEVLREFTVAVPDWAREKAGITADTKLDCEASEDAGVIAVYPASYRHDLTDVPRSILQCLLASGHSLYALNDILTAESENSDAE